MLPNYADETSVVLPTTSGVSTGTCPFQAGESCKRPPLFWRTMMQ